MKTTFYICMTSGVRGPELQLTDEQSQAILKIAEGLTKPWDGSKFAGLGLGEDHFSVFWEEDDGQHHGLRTESSGYVSIWRKGDTDWIDYRDTVGLWTHLAQYVSAAHTQWIEDQKKRMEAYQKWVEDEKAAGRDPYAWPIFNNGDP